MLLPTKEEAYWENDCSTPFQFHAIDLKSSLQFSSSLMITFFLAILIYPNYDQYFQVNVISQWWQKQWEWQQLVRSWITNVTWL